MTTAGHCHRALAMRATGVLSRADISATLIIKERPPRVSNRAPLKGSMDLLLSCLVAYYMLCGCVNAPHQNFYRLTETADGKT